MSSLPPLIYVNSPRSGHNYYEFLLFLRTISSQDDMKLVVVTINDIGLKHGDLALPNWHNL